MTERTARLVTEVLPRAPVRQWVLSLPYRLRYLLAWNHELCRAVLGVFAQTVLASASGPALSRAFSEQTPEHRNIAPVFRLRDNLTSSADQHPRGADELSVRTRCRHVTGFLRGRGICRLHETLLSNDALEALSMMRNAAIDHAHVIGPDRLTAA
jgi:hypothetical protein